MLALEDPLASKGVLGTLEASFGWNKKWKKHLVTYTIYKGVSHILNHNDHQ